MAADLMEAADSNSLAWLTTRVPMWALLLATAGAGATSIAGGSWRWLENNEPRFQVLSDRMVAIDARLLLVERSDAELRSVYERQHEELKAALAAAISEFRLDLSKKVDDTVRRAMLSAIMERLSQIDRHIDASDARINGIIDRMVTNPKGGRLGDAMHDPKVLAGMDGNNLSGHGSASVIAYQRQRRDRLRPVTF